MISNLISVIIPIYNRVDLLLETINCLRNQSYTKWECILVDDGSDSYTINLLKKFIFDDSRFKLFFRPNSLIKGAPSCRNYGFSVAKGEFVQWFDSDDIMAHNFLEKKVSILLDSLNVDFVLSKTDDLFEGEIINKYQLLWSENVYLDYITSKVYFFTPGPMFRRNFLKNKELFCEKFNRHQESDFYFRLLLYSPKVSFLNEVYAFRRLHSNSIGSSISSMNEKISYYILLMKYLDSIKNINISVWNVEMLVFFLKWAKSSIKFAFYFRSLGFLSFGFKLLKNSLIIQWITKFP